MKVIKVYCFCSEHRARYLSISPVSKWNYRSTSQLYVRHIGLFIHVHGHVTHVLADRKPWADGAPASHDIYRSNNGAVGYSAQLRCRTTARKALRKISQPVKDELWLAVVSCDFFSCRNNEGHYLAPASLTHRWTSQKKMYRGASGVGKERETPQTFSSHDADRVQRGTTINLGASPERQQRRYFSLWLTSASVCKAL